MTLPTIANADSHGLRTALAVATILACCVACTSEAGTEPFGSVAPIVRIEIANPEGARLVLREVCDLAIRPSRDLGAAHRFDIAVRSGRYRLDARVGAAEWSLPVPALDACLDGRSLRLEVVSPPSSIPEGFAWIPPGPALIGDTSGVGQEDERPAALVDVPAFLLATTEVTCAEYAAFLDAYGDEVDPRWCALDSLKCGVAREAEGGGFVTSTPRHPVVTVSLFGAEAYCAWRTRVTGDLHRLPREVEWEKAARGPDSAMYDYGDVYRRGAANQESGRLVEVGTYPKVGFGVCDMTGNVFEWTSDLWIDGHPATLGSTMVALERRSSYDRILRGGSFVLDGMYLRNSFRMRQSAAVRTDDFGFRVVRELHAPKETKR